jgi:two-component system phosphate regulon sensor histidine kinase PhoR
MMLVERILQSATLDKKDLRLKKESILLNELIPDQVEAAKLRLKQVNGNIAVNLPDGLVRVEGDRFHLANVISNLLDNAIKYSKDAPEISVVLKQDGKKVTLDIQDKGIGMKKEHLNKIFDKLYRIPTGNLHNVKGFGLGLSYVKAIIELHGWFINVKSKYGSGSTFTIEFKETTNG